MTHDRPQAIYLCPTGPCPQLADLAGQLKAALATRHGTVELFRPIVARGDIDPLLAALAAPNQPDDGRPRWGTTASDLLCDQAAAAQVLARFSACAKDQDAVVILGSSYDCGLAPVEFGWNARLAADLQVPMILVIDAAGTAQDLRLRCDVALATAAEHLAQVVGVIAICPTGRAVEPPTDLPVPVVLVEDGVTGPADPVLRADAGLADLLPKVRPTSKVVFDAARQDVPLGLLVAAATGKFPLPEAAIAVGAGPVPAGIQALWNEYAPHTPLLCAPGSAWPASADGSTTGSGQSRVARRLLGSDDLDRLLAAPALGSTAVTPVLFEHRLLTRAREADRHIVLPEGEEDRILRAAHRLLAERICRLTLLGDPSRIRARAAELGLELTGADLIDPQTSPLRERFAQRLAELRAHKGLSLETARQRVGEVSYFGTMMVAEELADGMVSGAVHSTAQTIRPALEVIKTRPDATIVSSVFLMCLADRVLVFGDCAVNPNPTPAQVAEIAITSAATAEQFGVSPRVALLSYSTGASGTGPDVEQVVEATRLVREWAPHLLVDGPLQYDAAVDPTVARTKAPDSPVAGRATVLVFPDLQTGNTTYKAVQRSAGAVAIGPVLQGLNRPVNDLSRGALVTDIVNTVAITAIQAAG